MTDMATLGTLLRLARDTVSDPKEAASTVLSFAPPRDALWLMFALVIVASMFLGEVVALLVQMPTAETGMMGSPIVLGLVQALFLFALTHAIHRIGRAFGGTGRFEEALLLVVWLQFVFIVVQLIQIVAILVVPPLAVLVTLVAMALFFWLLTNFIAVLHGFTNLGQVFLMIIVSIIGIAFALSIVLAILGVGLPQGPTP